MKTRCSPQLQVAENTRAFSQSESFSIADPTKMLLLFWREKRTKVSIAPAGGMQSSTEGSWWAFLWWNEGRKHQQFVFNLPESAGLWWVNFI